MIFATIAPFFSSQAISALPRTSIAGLITVYQKYLSPLKGFSCAHRVLHRGESCSQYVKRTILERGLSDALPQTRQRFRDCRSAYLTILASQSDHSDHSDHDDPESAGSGRPKNNPTNPQNLSCSGCTLPDPGDVACCVADSIDVGACDAAACDVGACDVGVVDCGGCDVGSC
jgi:putative component of membrane protein insertase Oxa1/YidC/SpoIIIJ protein YidD